MAKLSFEVNVSGVDSPIPVSATLEPHAELVVEAYPAEAQTKPTHGPLPVGFEGAFTPAYCEDVRAKATKAAGTGALTTWYRQQLRKGGGVTLSLPVTPLIGADFTRVLRTAAAAAGAQATAYRLQNPLVPTDVKIEIDFAPDAISNVVGDTASLVAEQQSYLSKQLAAIAVNGTFSTALSAKDVLCDLAQGAAAIRFEIDGHAGTVDFHGQTHLSVLTAE